MHSLTDVLVLVVTSVGSVGLWGGMIVGGNREARGGETEIVVVFRMVAKGAESSKNFFFFFRS